MRFLCAGVPFWWKSTEVYRAPLPFAAIEEHASDLASSAFALPCHLHIIFTSAPSGALMTRTSLENISKSFQKRAQGFALRVTSDSEDSCVSVGSEDDSQHWPCGLAKLRLRNVVDLRNDDEVDEFLSGGKNLSVGGRYTIVVFGKEAGDVERTVVGKYRHAWMTGVDLSGPGFENRVASRIAEVAVTYFRNGGRVGKEEDHVASMPLSADGEAILSFSLLNSNPEDWIFDWYATQLILETNCAPSFLFLCLWNAYVSVVTR